MDKADEKDSNTKSEPKVEIFGEEVGSSRKDWDKNCCNDRHFHFHHHHRSSMLGLALVLIGLLFLFSNFGMLPPTVWVQVSHLWPILIILIGFDILMGHSGIGELINSLIGLFIFATILGIVFIHTSPNLIHGLPANIQNYLYSLNNYLQIK